MGEASRPPEPLRIVVDDYAGHGFQIELARELAGRGHEVRHSYCSTNVTPHGDLEQHGEPNLSIRPVSTGSTFDKYSLPRRLQGELRYGLRAGFAHREFRPDVVLASNVPLVSLLVIRALNRRARHVLWLQDIQAGLASLVLGGRAAVLVKVLVLLERMLIRGSDEVVVISESMAQNVRDLAPRVETQTIENWSPLFELPDAAATQAWREERSLAGKRLILYSGTLGTKHRPDLLLLLASAFADDDDVRIVVASESPGVDVLRDAIAADSSIDNLVLLPFQDHSVFHDMLAAAEVLVVVLEREARSYSIPSKVLGYLAAGRPILGSLPRENSSFELIVNRAAAGFATDDDDEFVVMAHKLMDDGCLRQSMGDAGRSYARKNFELTTIADSFESVLRSAVEAARPT